jgi:hypothetical protein
MKPDGMSGTRSGGAKPATKPTTKKKPAAKKKR